MDIIYLKGLQAETIIGIYNWERHIKQTVIIDLEMGTDIQKAAASDSIEDTLDYKAISKRLLSFISESQFQLVETLADKIANIITTEFNVQWMRLSLNKKGALTHVDDVGVIIERGKKTDD